MESYVTKYTRLCYEFAAESCSTRANMEPVIIRPLLAWRRGIISAIHEARTKHGMPAGDADIRSLLDDCAKIRKAVAHARRTLRNTTPEPHQ